jgi:hypothetical protein
MSPLSPSAARDIAGHLDAADRERRAAYAKGGAQAVAEMCCVPGAGPSLAEITAAAERMAARDRQRAAGAA